MINKKVLGLVVSAVVVCTLATFVVLSLIAPAEQTPGISTGELDFTVSGTSDCLRFLNSSVSTVYVPFTVAANENWQLTINCTKMPGGANGWTDVYIYKGYWDKGSNHTCVSGDLYPILSDIQSADFEIRASSPYTESFGESTPQSYTVFFIFPPGGQSTFHITYKPT